MDQGHWKFSPGPRNIEIWKYSPGPRNIEILKYSPGPRTSSPAPSAPPPCCRWQNAAENRHNFIGEIAKLPGFSKHERRPLGQGSCGIGRRISFTFSVTPSMENLDGGSKQTLVSANATTALSFSPHCKIMTPWSKMNVKQSCKNVPTVPTSRCYFFWPVLIFWKSTRKTGENTRKQAKNRPFFGANFLGGEIGRC